MTSRIEESGQTDTEEPVNATPEEGAPRTRSQGEYSTAIRQGELSQRIRLAIAILEEVGALKRLTDCYRGQLANQLKDTNLEGALRREMSPYDPGNGSLGAFLEKNILAVVEAAVQMEDMKVEILAPQTVLRSFSEEPN